MPLTVTLEGRARLRERWQQKVDQHAHISGVIAAAVCHEVERRV